MNPLGMRRRGGLFATVVIGAVALAGVPFGSAQEEASAATESVDIDRLEFKFENPRTVMVYPGSNGGGSALDAGRIYWYLPYTVSYSGNKDTRFFVSILALSDKGRKYSDLALPHVEKKVEQIEGRALYSKVDCLAEGKQDPYVTFAAGETRKCVAIFNPLDPEADKIVIDVHGLVNDLKLEPLGEGRFRIEERVLRLTFTRPGDEVYTSLDRITFEGQKWVQIVRETPPPAG